MHYSHFGNFFNCTTWIIDKLSINLLNKIMNVPLVEDVSFFSKVGSGSHGINLLFKLHITFKDMQK